MMMEQFEICGERLPSFRIGSTFRYVFALGALFFNFMGSMLSWLVVWRYISALFLGRSYTYPDSSNGLTTLMVLLARSLMFEPDIFPSLRASLLSARLEPSEET